MPGESANIHGGFGKKYISKYIIFPVGLVGQGVLNTDPTVWLDEARPPPRYALKYMKIKMAESYISGI